MNSALRALPGDPALDAQRRAGDLEIVARCRTLLPSSGITPWLAAMDLFDRQWSTYRTVVDSNLMEHRELTAAIHGAIQAWLAGREEGAPRPNLVDLGCGDLGFLAPLLRGLPLGTYLGLDLCAQVLPRAEATLGAVVFPCQWRHQDLLSWAAAEPGSEPVQLLHSSFALHHLCAADKLRFLRLSRRHLAAEGLFLWADVFREPGESRQSYLARYSDRILAEWSPLSADQKAQLINHISTFDFPPDRVAIQRDAQACGWHWQWIWQGSHQAEALALLTPTTGPPR